MASRLRFFIMSSHGLVGLLTLCPTRGTSIIESLNERYSGSESDCSAAGQIFTPCSLCLPRVSTVCCWWEPRQHIVTELISPATRAHTQGQRAVTCSTVITLHIHICMVTHFISQQRHCTCCKYCEILCYYAAILHNFNGTDGLQIWHSVQQHDYECNIAFIQQIYKVIIKWKKKYWVSNTHSGINRKE